MCEFLNLPQLLWTIKLKKVQLLQIVFQENTIFDVLNLHFEAVLVIGINTDATK